MAHKLRHEIDRSARNYFLFQFVDQNERANGLRNRAVQESKFTDTISYPDWSPDPAHVCLLGFDDSEICAVAIAWLSEHKPASLSKLIRFDHVYFFDPLPADELITSASLPFPEEKHAVRKLNAATWAITRNFLIRLRPELSSEIEKLEKIIDNYDVLLEPSIQTILSQQKDAIGTSFDISGFDRKAIFSKFTLPDEFDSVFDGYEQEGGLEDEAILHDWSVFEGWKFEGVRKTVRTFLRKGEKLRIIIANKLPLERQTGVDLVYFSHKYTAFTLVQYKRMVPIKVGSSIFCYRPNDQFDEEVRRMNVILRRIAKEADQEDDELLTLPLVEAEDFRLLDNPFYFKYVKSDEFNPSGGALVTGRYVPLEYHQRILESPACTGPKGGRIIKWSNLRRYFGTTEFSKLVSDGWIGTCGVGTSVLKEIVDSALNQGKSAILAEHVTTSMQDNE